MKEKRFQKIYVEITNICNLKCSFCPDTVRQKKFIEVTEFKEIIHKIKPYTNLIYLHIKGEPLMHPKLEELLGACEKQNINVNITTNGTLLSERLNILTNSKAIRQINISLHSVKRNENTKEYSTEKYLNNILNRN